MRRRLDEGEIVDCYVCVTAGGKETAVAICRHCYVALCITHLAELELQGVNPGGMSTCDHKMPNSRVTEPEQGKSSEIQ